MTTSQEAREYPPTDDTLAGLAAKYGFRPRWAGDKWLSDAPLEMRSLFDLCREVVDADRKARQQEALDARRLDWLEASRLKASARGFTWDSLDFDTDKPIRDQLDAAIAKGERHE